jgi:hypothetical protein
MKDLEHYFEELKLKRIPEIYKTEAKIAAEKKLDYTEYLSGLIEKEYQSMIERSVNQRIRRAGFPCIKTIEGYDFTHQPQLNEKLIRYCRISPPISATKTQFRQFFREISNYSPKLAKFHHNLPHFSEFSFLFNTFLDSIRYPLHLQIF